MQRAALEGCGILVTGGTRGLGLAVVTLALERGARVAYCGRAGAAVPQRTQPSIRGLKDQATFVAADVGSPCDVERLFDLALAFLPRCDAVINNAGIALDRLLVETSLEDWQHVVTTNLRGPYLVGRRAAVEFRRRGTGGAIVNVSSVVANGSTGQAAYAATKAALVGLTRILAREYGPYGIRCNAVVPGFLRTEMTASLSETGQRVREQLSPHRRSGRLEEVAETVLFLASSDAAGLNGQALYVTGGIRDVPDMPG